MKSLETSVPDPWHFGVDPDPRIHCPWLTDPDPAIFVIDLQDANKKLIKKKVFSAYYFLKVHLHNFSKIKSPKEVTKQLESRFFLLFSLIIEESGSGAIPDPAGPKTCGSGILLETEKNAPKSTAPFGHHTPHSALSLTYFVNSPRDEGKKGWGVMPKRWEGVGREDFSSIKSNGNYRLMNNSLQDEKKCFCCCVQE